MRSEPKKTARVENDERHLKAKKSKFPVVLDAVVIVLVPLMRRFVPLFKLLEPADQSGFGLFR
jgi:hypothetical protein